MGERQRTWRWGRGIGSGKLLGQIPKETREWARRKIRPEDGDGTQSVARLGALPCLCWKRLGGESRNVRSELRI